MTPVDLLLSKLPDVKRNGQGWIARCPAHNDRRPSLSISVGDDGRALVHCHAGCSHQAIVEAIGLNVSDLMPPTASMKSQVPPRLMESSQQNKFFDTYQEAVASLQNKLGKLSGHWTYHDANGEVVCYVIRWEKAAGKEIRPVSRIDGGRWIIGGMSAPRPLYCLPELLNAPEGSRVYVCEGEKAADAMRALGLLATTSAHGSNSASKTDWSPLIRFEVVIVPDADDAGDHYANDVVVLLSKLGISRAIKIVHLLDLPEGKGGDIVDFIAIRDSDEKKVLAEVEELADKAIPIASVSFTPQDGPHLIRMSDVEPADISWLWPGRIPLGRLTLLVGRPGDGKSFLTAYLAANVSRGKAWVDGSPCPSGSVVLCSAEDDPADTIAPRLIAHDADRDKIHLLSGVMCREDNGEPVERVFTLADLHALRQTLERLPDCKLIIVDPIGSYLGGNADAHRDNEMRAVLAPVCHLASHYGAAVVVVAHTRKSISANADDMGSRAFTGLARSVLHLMVDPEDRTKQKRLLLPGKNNLAERPAGLAFDIGPGDVEERPCVRWIDVEVTITADEVVNRDAPRDDEKLTEQDEAADWLRKILANGPMPAAELKDIAKEGEGIALRTLDRAKKTVGVIAFRPKNPGPWFWQLPVDQAVRHHLRRE